MNETRGGRLFAVRALILVGYLLLTVAQLGLGWIGWIYLPAVIGWTGAPNSYWIAGGLFVNLATIAAQGYFLAGVFLPSLKEELTKNSK